MTLHNIEKSAFRNEYVGYGGGLVWRIVKGSQWYAHANGKLLTGARLADIQRQLEAI